MNEFADVKICRMYTEENGWKEVNIEDKWVGDYCEGIQSKKNPNVSYGKNPQYGLTLS